MKKILSAILAVILCASFCLLAASCSETGSKKYTVGIVQITQHVALDAATEGFKKALVDKLGEDAVEFDYKNASGEPANCTTIVNNFVSQKVDLIMANATPSLQAAYSATKDIPILGTSVTEYGVALGIENFNGTVGSNVSGTSDLAPLDEQAQMIIDLFPEAKTVGLLYCSAEANSEYQVKTVETYLKNKGIEAKRYSFSDSNDISAVTTAMAGEVDVVYIPTDNKAADSAEIIGNILRSAKKPAIAGEEGICSKCGVATLSISYYDLGYKTGLMAAEILSGTKKIEEMPIEYAPTTKKYNKTIADELGITIPEGYTVIE
ncbi:MAG: ABC transporter substrate-binding protein [Clostridia bacterium]|nr:ABC transporter substrate-binding protein [Clostridia bacterium]